LRLAVNGEQTQRGYGRNKRAPKAMGGSNDRSEIVAASSTTWVALGANADVRLGS